MKYVIVQKEGIAERIQREYLQRGFEMSYEEALEKAMMKPGLVAKKVSVKDQMKGTYQALRWTRPGEAPKGQEKRAMADKPTKDSKGISVKRAGEVGQAGQRRVGEKFNYKGRTVAVTHLGKDGITAYDSDGKKYNLFHEDTVEQQDLKPGEEATGKPKPGEKIDTFQRQKQYTEQTRKMKYMDQLPEGYVDYPDFMGRIKGEGWSVGQPEVMQYKDKIGVDIPLAENGGKPIGHFEVQFSNNGKEINIHSAFLSKDWQGKGIGTDLIHQSIEYAKAKGIQKATMMANGAVGVYAWGIQGFDWKKPNEIKELKDEFSKWLLKKYGEQVDPGQFKHSWDLASYKIGDEKVGKKFLLGPGHSLWFESEMDLANEDSMSWKLFKKYQELRGQKRGE